MRGFTLVELAIVTLIVGILMGSGLIGMSAYMKNQQVKETQRLIDEAREALLGYAAANGRLPCPATAASAGVEAPPGGGACTNADGFLPHVTLNMPGGQNNGLLLDAWASPIRYAVTTASGGAATTTDGIKGLLMSTFATAADLKVCSTSTGITATACSSPATTLASNAVAVIYSLGANAGTGVAGRPDEAANQDGNRTFVSHPPAESGAPNGEFDDILTWIGPPYLFNRMLQAMRLP